MVGTGAINVSGDATDNTLTISLSGTVGGIFNSDAGFAIPVANILNLFGGPGILTSAAGNTVTFTASGTVAGIFHSDAGNAIPALNILNVTGGSGILTQGSGNTLTISASGTLAGIFHTDSGNAFPAANILNIVGGTGITTSGGGNTVTVSLTGSGAIETITGNTGGALDPTAGNFNFLTSNSTVIFAGAGSTETLSFTTDANNNLVLGSSLPSLAGGVNNTGLGGAILNALTTGNGNTGMGFLVFQAINTGLFNTAIGQQSLQNITSDSYNTAIGFGSMQAAHGGAARNTAVGYASLDLITTGSYSTCVGMASGNSYTSTESSNICIGYNTQGTLGESNVLRIGNGTGTGNGQIAATYIAGIDGVNLTTANVVTESSNQLGSAVITAGTGISISTATPNQIIISATGSGFTWNDVVGGSATLAAENGYIADAAGLTTFTMPTNNAFGDTIKIVGKGAGGWKIIYSANQNIIFGSSTSTTTTGNISSTNRNDCIELVCTTTSATQPIFTVVNSIGSPSIT